MKCLSIAAFAVFGFLSTPNATLAQSNDAITRRLDALEKDNGYYLRTVP